MKITAYRIHKETMIMRPASNLRQWMDDTEHRYAYRCLPLQIANSSGYELLAPSDFLIVWNGGRNKSDLSVHIAQKKMDFAHSTFGHGIITFHTGFIFETDKDWDLLVSGLPNYFYDFMVPLTGIVETWWLPFTFTMNWKIQKPGTYLVKKDEPLVFLMPIPHVFPTIEAEIKDLKNNEKLNQDYSVWKERRNTTIKSLDHLEKTGEGINGIDPKNPTSHWEKNYMRGLSNSDVKMQEHLTKRRFPNFEEKK